MAIKEDAFSQERSLEALLLIASKLPHSSTVWDVLRVTYLADKLHFAQYGFLATRDVYNATQDGAVPAGTLRVLGYLWDKIDASSADRRFASLVRGSLLAESGGKSRVKPARQPDLSFLSEAEIECIRQAAAEYVSMSPEVRARVTTDKAWEEAWHARPEAAAAVPIDLEAIASTLDNADEVFEYLDE